MPKTAIGLMARYPTQGQVKTRLAKTIGDERALQIYRALLQYSSKLMTDLNRQLFMPAVFVYPEEDLLKFQEDYPSFDLYSKQTGDNLGERMKHALHSLLSFDNISTALLIGADCPELTTELLLTIPSLLEDNDLVLGPSQDGGYYLIGMKKIHEKLFSGIKWGTSTVLERTLATTIQIGLKVKLLEQLRDLDDEKDLTYFLSNGILNDKMLNPKG